MTIIHVLPASNAERLEREEALHSVALAASLLFKHGQTTERVVLSAERLGVALGQPSHILPTWGAVVVSADYPRHSDSVPAMPLGVDMGRVVALTKVVDRICDGALARDSAWITLFAAGQRPPISTIPLILMSALGAAAMGVIFGALDPAHLMEMAASAGIGALVRRPLMRFCGNPFIPTLCASAVGGATAALAGRLLQNTDALVALCPCMILVPGPHILNGAIDLARARIPLGIARLAYAGMVLLMISAGLLVGFAGGGAPLSAVASSLVAPSLLMDVAAAGCAAAAFGASFSIPYRLLPLPVLVGMLAHAVRWGLIFVAGTHVAVGVLVACLLVGTIMAPVADRLHLPFAALAFSAVVAMLPGFYLFQVANDLIRLISLGPRSPVDLLMGIAANGTTAFLIVLAMTAGLILPRLLFVTPHARRHD
jgi:uncharacterized membrane protein YjjP (DUF1212 family)